MRFLIQDFLRRNKWLILVPGVALILKAAVPPVSYGLAASGFWVGLVLGFSIDSRVIIQLPISRRDIWRTRWILWNLFPVVALAGVRLLVLAAETTLSRTVNIRPSWILLSSAMELSFLGTLFVGSALMESFARKLVSPPKALFIKFGFYIAIVGLTGFTSAELPTEWGQLTNSMILALGFGLALTAISYFHSPRIVPRTKFSNRLRPAARSNSPDSNLCPWTAGPVGLNLLVRKQLFLILCGAIATGIASQIPVVIGELVKPNGRSALDRMSVFIEPIPAGAVITFIAPVLVNALLLIFAPDLLGVRHLRTLPLPSWVVGFFLTLIPVVFWLVFWVFPISAYWVFADHLPSTLRLDILAGLAGLACLSGAVGVYGVVKDPGLRVTLPFLSIPGFLALLSHGLPLNFPMSLFVGTLGLLGVAVSFWLNCRGLERNRSAYVPLLRAAARERGV